MSELPGPLQLPNLNRIIHLRDIAKHQGATYVQTGMHDAPGESAWKEKLEGDGGWRTALLSRAAASNAQPALDLRDNCGMGSERCENSLSR